jgi:hypothetical protein
MTQAIKGFGTTPVGAFRRRKDRSLPGIERMTPDRERVHFQVAFLDDPAGLGGVVATDRGASPRPDE